MGLLYFIYIQYLNKPLNRKSVFQGSFVFCMKPLRTVGFNIWKRDCLLCYKMYVCLNFKAHYIRQENAISLLVSPAVGCNFFSFFFF